jgi:hypothetical protein
MRQFAFVLFCAGLLATQASAGILTFTDAMFGNNETPPTGSPATGQAKVTVDTVANTLRVQESWTGLIGGAASAAHIHCCSLPGVAAPVALPFTGFPGTSSGTYDTTFDLTLTTTYTSGFLASGGGTAAGAESLLISSMTAGLTYTNIHNATFPGGEIRGQLASIPEPGTMALGGAGLLGLIGVVRRRRRA